VPSGIQPVNLVEGALLLRRNAYRPRLIGPLGQEKSYFEDSARLLRVTRIFTLARPWDLNGLEKVIAQLTAHWATLGLRTAVE
jgi:hypothetical protein